MFLNQKSQTTFFFKSDSGFSLFEMLVAMVIFLIVGFASSPYISGLMESFTKRNAEMQVLEDLRLAQSTAVEQGCRGIFAVASDNLSYSFGCDYTPHSTSSPPVPDSIAFTRPVPPRITVAASGLIIFNSRGLSVDETGSLVARTVTLTINRHGLDTIFNSGTLRPMGHFSFES